LKNPGYASAPHSKSYPLLHKKSWQLKKVLRPRSGEKQ